MGVAACSSQVEPPTDSSTRAAICGGGGGGGGGGCIDDGTGCPAECSMCFSSLESKLHLMNLWECSGGTGGGGGNGGCTSTRDCPNGKICVNGACAYPQGGCSAAQIAAAKEDCHAQCNAYPSCSDDNSTGYYCSAANGIHGCQVVNGTPEYSCANELSGCAE